MELWCGLLWSGQRKCRKLYIVLSTYKFGYFSQILLFFPVICLWYKLTYIYTQRLDFNLCLVFRCWYYLCLMMSLYFCSLALSLPLELSFHTYNQPQWSFNLLKQFTIVSCICQYLLWLSLIALQRKFHTGAWWSCSTNKWRIQIKWKKKPSTTVTKTKTSTRI